MTSMQLVLHDPDQAPILPDDALDLLDLAGVSFGNALEHGDFLVQQDHRPLGWPYPSVQHIQVRADRLSAEDDAPVGFCGCHGQELTPSSADGAKAMNWWRHNLPSLLVFGFGALVVLWVWGNGWW